jgi:osmoprotectant transport system ATP-binding protein
MPEQVAGRAATVELERVTKHYDRREVERSAPGAVNDLSLAVPAGKICVLVGPSGCGKTTSLKMVNRLIEPTSGRILLDGVDAAARDVTELRRGIGYVIQQVGLFPHQTIAENVATVPRLLGWPQSRQRERADELLHLVGLDPATYAGRFPIQLSGGERQRVGVARALAADPPLMLMDEPFGAVDPIVRGRLQDEFLRLQESLAKTILFVTHDIDEAIKMGDLVAVLQEGGTLAQFGPPAEILASPATPFVARFVGADRGLKRLSLLRVADLDLVAPVTARAGDLATEEHRRVPAGAQPWLLLLDEGDRPIAWIARSAVVPGSPLAAAPSTPAQPLLDRRATLKDALSVLLDADVQAGIVVDRERRVLGLVTVADITALLRDSTLLAPGGGAAEPVASVLGAPESAGVNP